MTLEQRKERLLAHMARQAYVAINCERLRRARGARSQFEVACMADVAQCYVSRVESGSAQGIGVDPLLRLLTVYEELECSRTSGILLTPCASRSA